MTYIVKAYNWKDARRILKGWDGKMPVWVQQREFNKGKVGVQEFRNQYDAMQAINKIKAVESWRHYDIVGLV